MFRVNPLSAKFTKWSNTLKQSVFEHFVGLGLKELTIKTSERRHWRCAGVFIVNFEHISHPVLVFLLLILSR